MPERCETLGGACQAGRGAFPEHAELLTRAVGLPHDRPAPEAADDGDLVFSDDLAERLCLVEAAFHQRMKPMFDSYIAATGMSAPEPVPPRKNDWLPSESARLNLEVADVTSVLWATG